MDPDDEDRAHAVRLESAASSLRDSLRAAHFVDLHSAQVTSFLTASIARWATGHSYLVNQEVQLPADAPRRGQYANDGYRGRLNLRAHHPAGGDAISIEIDRGNKRWSVEKLAYAARRGDLAVWVRWSAAPATAAVSDRVHRLHVGTTRRKLSGASKHVHSLSMNSCT